MLLLAIDTSTSAITVALHNGTAVVAAASEVAPRAHGERLAPMVRSVLEQARVGPDDVTAVVAGEGPGPFTGLRVGLVTACVFAWARGVPAYGLGSLDALAWRSLWDGRQRRPFGDRPPGQRLLVATDARRKEVYWATYEVSREEPERLDGPSVGRAADLPSEVRALPSVGRGALLYPEALTAWSPAAGPILDVDAGALADLAARRLARGESLADPTPRYLRRPDARPAAALVTRRTS
ncbi:MAG: tRNA (adenosine(37)-N6)-threonylcarbamoyltransferase complex dimerization subunit type 1 TsaB [Dermatophilaceae bacterium]